MLIEMVDKLTDLGITMTITKDGVRRAEFKDGFYRGDGYTYLIEQNGQLILMARYNEMHVIETVDDVIEVSREWYEYSKGLSKAWAQPAGVWGSLYGSWRKVN